MDSGNQSAPCFATKGLIGFQLVSETPSVGIRLPYGIFQASATHLHVDDGEHRTHGVDLSEHTISFAV